MKLKKGLLVAFEGIDGAGKSTQAKMLYRHLKRKGIDAILSSEPTQSVYGMKIRKLAHGRRDQTTPAEEYDLFVSDRKLHCAELIRPALSRNKAVILDRYYFSTIAYQGALGLDPARIRQENEAFCPVPDLVFLLMIPPKEGIGRIRTGRGETPDSFEREEGLRSVASLFDSLEDNFIHRIDAAQDPERIHGQIVRRVDALIESAL